MANWQSIAANQDLSQAELVDVRWDLIWSAIAQMFAPSFLGVWLGVMLRALNANLVEEQYFTFAFGVAFPELSVITGLGLGIVILGFLSATFSSVDNYLLAATQTIAVDIVKREKIALASSLDADSRMRIETEVLNWCKNLMPYLALFSVGVFACLFYALRSIDKVDSVFAFQFVMYGAAVTLVPLVAYALFFGPRDHSSPALSSGFAFYSVLSGLVFVLGPFLYATFIWNTELGRWSRTFLPDGTSSTAITNLTPVMGLFVASLVFTIGCIRRRRSTKNRQGA